MTRPCLYGHIIIKQQETIPSITLNLLRLEVQVQVHPLTVHVATVLKMVHATCNPLTISTLTLHHNQQKTVSSHISGHSN